MMRPFVVTIALLLLLVAVATQLSAAGDNIYWADNGVPICAADYNQTEVQLVGDGFTGAVICWQDYRNGVNEIWAQRVDVAGDTMWAADGVLVASPDYGAMNPQITTDGSAGGIIVWEDWRSGIDLYAQRVDASGDTLWVLDGVPITQAADNQVVPQIISDGAGGAIIAWEDYRSGSHYDIYAQRVDASGNRIWAVNGQAICTASDQQRSPQLCADGSGGAIIVWYDNRGGVGFNIYAQRIDANGNTKWTGDGVVICNATENQEYPHIVTDGSGGAIIGWRDLRPVSHYDIYASRIDSGGTKLWFNNGLAVCSASGSQYGPLMVSDGHGGAILAWRDYRSGSEYDIYAQKLDANGNMLWTTDGQPICTAPDNQSYLQVASDGSGGAILAWGDFRSSIYDVYAQRVDAYGDTIPPVDGLPICNALQHQYNLQLISDGLGGVIIAWEDYRGMDHFDVYAQRVHFDPAAEITSITDVPEDQGRQVSISWDRSYLDDPWYRAITEYSLWRKYPLGAKGYLVGQEWDGTLPDDRDRPIYRLIEETGPTGEMGAKAWEYIGSVKANYFQAYAYIAPTLYDSSAGDPAYFSFIVTAHTEDPFVHWDSTPDSGYSVDDVDPAKTQVGIMASGSAKGSVNTIWLAWTQVTTGHDGSPEQGPIDYRIYCDESFDFAPGPGNLVAMTADLSYGHTDGRIGDPVANLFYLVTAVDQSGNESAVSNVVGEFDRYLSDSK